jgi:hypothetical protein
MISVDETSAYLRRPDLNAVVMDGELVMMGVEQGEYFGLRDVAATIWEALAEPATLDQLCAAVSAEYAVTPEACRADVAAFLDQMLDKKLIDRVG